MFMEALCQLKYLSTLNINGLNVKDVVNFDEGSHENLLQVFEKCPFLENF